MLVTTSYHPTTELAERAERIAERLGAVFAERGRTTLAKLRSMHGMSPVLVVSADGLRLDLGNGSPLFFHPSMAMIRYKRVAGGMRDPLLEISRAKRGDAVVDCTAGLASDSILFAHVVGTEGSVDAYEAEPILAFLLEEGLASYESGEPGLDAAMRRIRVHAGDHLDALRGMGDRSADIVYFDPMFRTPVHESSGISPLRSVADDRPLSKEAVAEAKRVSRGCVLLKEHRSSAEFERLGFAEVVPAGSKIAYGVIRC